MTDNLTILTGNCLDVLPTLPDESVQTCVTSPPYWGLRDYGSVGQIGLEDTPEAYVGNLVDVFREVRRVLRRDGTLWLNLGASYFGSGQGGNPDTSQHQKQKTNRGSFSYVKRPNRSRADVPPCGSDGKALRDLRATGSSCSDLCDGCRAVLLTGIDCTSRQPSQSLPLHETTDRDIVRSDFVSNSTTDALPSAQESTILGFYAPHQEGCRHCANCDACLSVLHSTSRDASLCVRRGLCSDGTFGHGLVSHNHGMDVSVKAYQYLSTPSLKFKPKDLVNIPFYVAEALRADGWYLRSDVIWNKPNPMPESVTDRPTRAHEYIFLLSKSPKYYYDATAIREPASPALLQQIENGYNGHATKDFEANGVQNASDTKSRIIQSHRNRIDKQRGHSRKHPGFNARWDKLSVDEQRMCGSNKRSVWTVAPANFKESHFATFPPDLIKPCILAGCPVGGVVLDPFAGSFTTCAVALELGRKAIGIELNPKYVEIGRQRCAVVTPGLAL